MMKKKFTSVAAAIGLCLALGFPWVSVQTAEK